MTEERLTHLLTLYAERVSNLEEMLEEIKEELVCYLNGSGRQSEIEKIVVNIILDQQAMQAMDTWR